jgi:putative endonuclease
MAKNVHADQLGKSGELHVARFLEHRKCRIIERNWRIKNGEIDIIALSPEGIYLFIEVKSRSSEAFGHPLESISIGKVHRLQKLALAWLALHGKFGSEYRIDAAAVLLRRGVFEIDYREAVA